jgi:hypothetical protein
MSRSSLWAIVGALAIGVVAVVGYKYLWPQLFPEPTISAALDPKCDLQKGPCTSKVPGGGKVTFSIGPTPIIAMRELTLKVHAEGLDPDTVQVDFTGVSMNMGFNRFTLKSQGEGAYVGKAVLPICIRNRMSWKAKVMMETDRGLIVAPYEFDSTAPPR